MTESDWLQATDGEAMLRSLQGRAGERKLRLFAVACAHLLWTHLSNGRMQEAVAVAERRAEGMISVAELRRVVGELTAIPVSYGSATGRNWFEDTPPDQVAAYFAALLASAAWESLAKIPDRISWEQSQRHTAQHQPHLLRDVFGNPFRSVTADPRWLTGSVIALAQAMYHSRDFSQMAALADGLVIAGCDNRDILTHCREGGLHVRGCWVVDLILSMS